MPLTVTVSKVKGASEKYKFCADCKEFPGSPPVGYGSTPREALGDWLNHHTATLGITLEYDEKTNKFELQRKVKEYEKSR